MRLLTIAVLFSPFLGRAQTLETVIQKGHELSVQAIAISPDSNFIATASKDKSAKLWEVHTGREVRSFLGHDGVLTSLAFTPDGKFLLTGSRDKTVKIWNVANGKLEHNITKEDMITDVAVDPRGKFFVHSGYHDFRYGDTAVVYDLKSRKPIAKLPVAPDKGLGNGVDIAVSPDGQWIALGEDNRKVQLYETQTWTKKKEIEYPTGYCGGCIARVAFSPDNKSIYISTQRGDLRKVDILSGALVKTYDKVDDLKGIAISPDGSKIAVAPREDSRVWEEGTGKLIASINAESGSEFLKIEFGLNNKTLFISANNGTAIAWNVLSNKRERISRGF